MNSNEICTRLKITQRQLNYWIQCGLPEVRTGHGSGYPREFTHREFRIIRFAAALTRLGVDPVRVYEYAVIALTTGKNVYYDKDGIAFVAVPERLVP